MGGWMRSRALIAVMAVSVSGWLAANVNAGQAPSDTTTFKVPASTYTPPKTPWGDPDLQGVWDNHTVGAHATPREPGGQEDVHRCGTGRTREGSGEQRTAVQSERRAVRQGHRRRSRQAEHLQRILDAAGLRVRQPDVAHRGSGGWTNAGDDAGGHRRYSGSTSGCTRPRTRTAPMPSRSGTGRTTTSPSGASRHRCRRRRWATTARSTSCSLPGG